MKFCKDCKHVFLIPGDPDRAKCFAPQNIVKDGFHPVSGQPSTFFDTAVFARAFYGDCGDNALWFEPSLREELKAFKESAEKTEVRAKRGVISAEDL